jgi:sugar phosphate isomerase/epimerase
MTRRNLLATGLAGAALTGAPSLRIGCQTNAWKIDPKQFPTLLSALDSIKKLGFQGFETGFRNLEGQFAEPQVAQRALKKTGLRFYGCHIFLLQYDAATNVAPRDLWEKVARGAGALGAERLILSGAPCANDDALKRKAEALTAAGRFCHDLKLMRLCYHNHGPEFERDGWEIEGLIRHTDPQYVHFLVDCGHAFRRKAKVAEFFQRHQARIDGMHLRDFANDVQVPLGQGTFDYASLATAVKQSNWRGWILAEEERESGDKPADTAAGPARQTIKKLFGA